MAMMITMNLITMKTMNKRPTYAIELRCGHWMYSDREDQIIRESVAKGVCPEELAEILQRPVASVRCRIGKINCKHRPRLSVNDMTTIRKMLIKGHSLQQISDELGISYCLVRKYANGR